MFLTGSIFTLLVHHVLVQKCGVAWWITLNYVSISLFKVIVSERFLPHVSKSLKFPDYAYCFLFESMSKLMETVTGRIYNTCSVVYMAGLL